jgi:hypothetical protein
MEHIYLVLCSSTSMHVGSPHSAIPLDASSVPAMLYFPCMNETQFEERFDRLEKHLESVAKQIDVLARAEACTAVRRFVAFLCVHSARIPPFPDRTSAALHCAYLRQVRTKGMVQWRSLFTNT